MTQAELDRIIYYCNDEIKQYLLYGVPIRYAIKTGYFNVEEFYTHHIVREDFPKDELEKIIAYLNKELREMLEEYCNIREKLKYNAFCDLDLITNDIVKID